MAWQGGKDGAGVAQRLINQIPPHDIFVSAFLGDCAVLRKKRPAALSIGIDLDRDNVDRWRTGPPFHAPLELYGCDSIEWLRHRFGLYRVEAPAAANSDAARSDVIAAKNRGGGPYSSRHAPRGGIATPGAVAEKGDDGSRAPSTATLDRAATPIGHHAERGDYCTHFVYVDPPYLLKTRRSKGRLYKHELTDEQHVELLSTLKTLPCLVMVSHYPCRLYDDALGDWRSFTFAAVTRGGGLATEKVWCNYPAPVALHDARYLGRNKRERERIRRRRQNWVGGLDRMPPLERQAVLDAITGR